MLAFVDVRGASHLREMHIEVLRRKPGMPEHTVRAPLSETVCPRRGKRAFPSRRARASTLFEGFGKGLGRRESAGQNAQAR